jgi:indole-3-glycerol phosphate synthase
MGPSPRIIAEIKRRSPSRGLLRPELDVAALAAAYTAGGAAALSVLTEEDHFDGSLVHLGQARAATHLPILRKDFITDPYQVYETRAAGADAVLLIVAALEPARLADLAALAIELGLAALVETHNREEVETAVGSGAQIVGINNRNLHTLEVSLDTCLDLAPRVPADRQVVAESGIHGSGDVRRLEAAGIHVFLVGEHLMLQADVAAALQELGARPGSPSARGAG